MKKNKAAFFLVFFIAAIMMWGVSISEAADTETQAVQNAADDADQPEASPNGTRDRLMASWSQLTSNLTEALNLRDRHETLPASSWIREDRRSNARRINALLTQSIEILLQSEANDLREQAIALRAEIPVLQVRLFELRNEAISAPESSRRPWGRTRTSMEEDIARLQQEITEKERALTRINAQVTLALRGLGVDLDDRQINILLTSVTGDDIFQHAVIFANVKQVVVTLGELAQGDLGNLEIARRYAGMYLVMNDLLIITQEGLLEKIETEYKPRLAAIHAEAEGLRREALERSAMPQFTEAQQNTFRTNAEANALTVRVADLYAELLENQSESVRATLVTLHNARYVAENTYRTIRSSADLRNLIQSGLELFDTIHNLSLSMPQIQAFEYDAIRKEFEEINRRLRSN